MPTKTKNTIADTMKTASTNGKSSGKEIPYQHHTLTSEDLEREYAFPVAPESLGQIPDGALMTGPNTDGSKSFRGTLEQAGVPKQKLIEWYKLMHLGRLCDDAAANYLKKAMGWSYHAPCAGHEGIQAALGISFRQKQDYLFPYYRDLMTASLQALALKRSS